MELVCAWAAMSRVRAAALGVAFAGAAYLAQRQLVWARAVTAVDGLHDIAGEVPDCRAPARLTPPALVPPAAVAAGNWLLSTAEATWRGIGK